MAQINIAEAVANHAIFREKRKTPPGATRIYSFLAKQRDKLTGAHLEANIAILASLNQYLADEQSFAFSASRVLSDAGINHVIIVEKDLINGDLSNLDLIYLPNIPLLSTKKQQALLSWVEQGGTLLLLGQCGVKDQYNILQDKNYLAEALGEAVFPSARAVIKKGSGRIIHLPLTIPDSKFLIPSKSGENATTFGPSMADVFADIPEGYTRNRIDPQLREHLEYAAREITTQLNNNITRISEGTPYLELTTMNNEAENVRLVHLVNYDVVLDGTVTPAENVVLEIRIRKGRIARNVQYSGDLGELKPVTFVQNGSRMKFTVPHVDIYGMAVIEF
jgi:hypothetical protein